MSVWIWILIGLAIVIFIGLLIGIIVTVFIKKKRSSVSPGTQSIGTPTTGQVSALISPAGELDSGRSLVSPNGNYSLVMQTDGNLVGLDMSNNPFWASNTYNKGSLPNRVVMQGDGNLVIYDSTGKAVWASNSNGKGTAPYRLVMQDDGNIVIYDANNTVIWTNKVLITNKAKQTGN